MTNIILYGKSILESLGKFIDEEQDAGIRFLGIVDVLDHVRIVPRGDYIPFAVPMAGHSFRGMLVDMIDLNLKKSDDRHRDFYKREKVSCKPIGGNVVDAEIYHPSNKALEKFDLSISSDPDDFFLHFLRDRCGRFARFPELLSRPGELAWVPPIPGNERVAGKKEERYTIFFKKLSVDCEPDEGHYHDGDFDDVVIYKEISRETVDVFIKLVTEYIELSFTVMIERINDVLRRGNSTAHNGFPPYFWISERFYWKNIESMYFENDSSRNQCVRKNLNLSFDYEKLEYGKPVPFLHAHIPNYLTIANGTLYIVKEKPECTMERRKLLDDRERKLSEIAEIELKLSNLDN